MYAWSPLDLMFWRAFGRPGNYWQSQLDTFRRRGKCLPNNSVFWCQITALPLLVPSFERCTRGNGWSRCRGCRWSVECSSKQMIREEAGVFWFSILINIIRDQVRVLFRSLLLQLAVPFPVLFLLLRFGLGELLRDVFLSSDHLPFGSREGYLLWYVQVVSRG